jgi:hypothetical protein
VVGHIFAEATSKLDSQQLNRKERCAQRIDIELNRSLKPCDERDRLKPDRRIRLLAEAADLIDRNAESRCNLGAETVPIGRHS